jgi:membrane fusion protein (multidrug efflux system)
MAAEQVEKTADRLKKGRRIAVMILLMLVLVAVALTCHYWRRAQIHVTTDDAYVHGSIHRIGSRVPGTVVEESRLLARLDFEPFEVVVRNAEAPLELAGNEVAQMKAAVQAAKAGLSLPEVSLG